MTAPPSGLRRNSSRSPERLARRLNPRCVPARTSNTADTRRHRQTRLSRRSEAIPQLAISVSTDWLRLREDPGVTPLGVAALQRLEVQPTVDPAQDLAIDHRASRQSSKQCTGQLGEHVLEHSATARVDVYGISVGHDPDRPVPVQLRLVGHSAGPRRWKLADRPGQHRLYGASDEHIPLSVVASRSVAYG